MKVKYFDLAALVLCAAVLAPAATVNGVLARS